MDLETLKTLVDCYGTDPGRWPEDKQAGARALIARSAAARSIVHESMSLDAAMDRASVNVDVTALEARIMSAVARQSTSWMERFIDWLMPDLRQPVTLWRPALAASLPLVFGVVLGISVSFDSINSINSIDTYSDEEALIMMGLVITEESLVESSQ